MAYKVTLSKRASTYLSRLPQKTATRILDKLELLKSDPFHVPDTKALEGKLKGLWRMKEHDPSVRKPEDSCDSMLDFSGKLVTEPFALLIIIQNRLDKISFCC